MVSESMMGHDEQLKTRVTHAYYFGGVMMTSSHLEPIRQVMISMYHGKENVTVLSSSLSKDLPSPRKKDVADSIEKRLKKGERVKLVCHSLGTVEAMRVMRTIDPHLIRDFYDQISIDLISPAGLFADTSGMTEFLRRFVNNSVLRERIKPTLRRGIESLAIYPPAGMDEFYQTMKDLIPNWEGAVVQGNPDKISRLLRFDPILLEKLLRNNEAIQSAIEHKDRRSLEIAITQRGKILLPKINQFQTAIDHTHQIGSHKKSRLHLRHFTEAGRILIRLLTGKTNETLKKLFIQNVRVRFVYMAKDPIVLKQDIIDFYEALNWDQLLESGLVIPVGDLGHSSHVILPEVLKLLE